MKSTNQKQTIEKPTIEATPIVKQNFVIGVKSFVLSTTTPAIAEPTNPLPTNTLTQMGPEKFY